MLPITPQSINAAAAFSNNSSYSTAFLPFVDLAAPTSQPLPAARLPPDSQQEEASCPLTQVGRGPQPLLKLKSSPKLMLTFSLFSCCRTSCPCWLSLLIGIFSSITLCFTDGLQHLLTRRRRLRPTKHCLPLCVTFKRMNPSSLSASLACCACQSCEYFTCTAQAGPIQPFEQSVMESSSLC